MVGKSPIINLKTWGEICDEFEPFPPKTKKKTQLEHSQHSDADTLTMLVPTSAPVYGSNVGMLT